MKRKRPTWSFVETHPYQCFSGGLAPSGVIHIDPTVIFVEGHTTQ